MLRISKLADYAVVILHHLMTSEKKIQSASEIAREVHLAIPTVSKILKILAESRLVVSMRGAGGGYGLAFKPEKITLAQIISAMEGLPSLTQCGQVDRVCKNEDSCGVRPHWQAINHFILETLRQVTLADMSPSFKITKKIRESDHAA